MQYQLRTALEIRLNSHFSVVPIGYVWTENFRYGKQPAAFKNNEHRLWEQISYKHELGRFKFEHRLRLEQRFIQVHSRTAEGTPVDEGFTNQQNRLRYRLTTKIPLGREKNITTHTLFASTYDEVFYSWGKSITFREPDQNRLFAGLGYQVSKPLVIQAGFLYQMLIKANGTQQENNIGCQVMLNYTLDLTH
jgi:long-subunit fatty acid transport protein